MSIDDQRTDGERLKALFDAHKARTRMTQKQFAERYKVPGGPAVISQHIAGLRPISMKQASAYMNGFGCQLHEISPALARKVQGVSTTNSPAPTHTVVAPPHNLASDNTGTYGSKIDSALRMLRGMDADLLDDAHGLIEHVYSKQLMRSKAAAA